MSLAHLFPPMPPLDQAAMQAARSRQSILTKPAGSLGRLEALSIQVAGITARALPHIRDKVVLVMAGDHGVVAEGVSLYPAEVTPQMVLNFLNGGAAINVLAQHAGARVVVVDMGVAADLPPHPHLVVKKVARGTANIARGPAMTRAQALQAIESGAAVVSDEIGNGLDLLVTGDMGIGNTTPSAAIAAALTGFPVSTIAGRGTGLDDIRLAHKIAVIERSLQVNCPHGEDGLDVLAKVGGFEIGGLAGAILAAASARIPVVIDGFISTAAAMIAAQLCPPVKQVLIAGHRSQELGHQLMLEWLGLTPVLDLDLRLGEGTGGVLAASLVEASCKILSEMASFGEAGVSQKEAA